MQKPVLIVGGGIGGLTLALALKRAGIPVEVWERVASYKPVGAGIGLAINAMAVLRALGVGAQVEAAGAAITHFRIADQREAVVAAIDRPKSRGPTVLQSASIAARCTKPWWAPVPTFRFDRVSLSRVSSRTPTALASSRPPASAAITRSSSVPMASGRGCAS